MILSGGECGEKESHNVRELDKQEGEEAAEDYVDEDEGVDEELESRFVEEDCQSEREEEEVTQDAEEGG